MIYKNDTLLQPNLTFQQVKELIAFGVDVNEVDEIGSTPLFYIHDLEIMKYLIAHGAKIDVKDEDGLTLLFDRSNIEILDFLRESGLNINEKNNRGMTPLFFADIRNIEYLIKHSSNINERNWLNRTPLPYYCKNTAYIAIKNGMIPSEIETYHKFREYFSVEQQKAFDMFLTLTNNDNDFFHMCLVYQEGLKNNVKMDIKEMDIL